ncbi:hypothetical protein M408DRAFT_79252, partial [Serendipita vermifera MAFF 305830]
SILEVFILCFAGWILARRNLLDKKTQKKLNILNINLFTPALLFSKVAFFLSPSKLKELWIIPFIFVIVTLTSMITSWGLAKACRLRRSQRSFAMAASMFMNSNSLPIALMQSLVVTVHGLKWGKDDTRDGMLGRSLTYLVLHSTFGMMLRWSFGVRLLAQADEEIEVVPPSDNPTQEAPNGRNTSPAKNKGDERQPLLSAGQRMARSVTEPVTQTESLGLPAPIRPARPPMVNKQSHFFYSFPNTPQLSSTSLAVSHQDLPEPTTHSPPEVSVTTQIASTVSSATSTTRTTLAKWGKGLKDFMTPPLYAALLSLIVACIQPLQHLLAVHLLPVKGAISSAGNCSIPITLVVLGGYFWRGDGSEENPTSNQQPPLRTDLPQQLQTAAPPLVRRKTRAASRSDTLWNGGNGNGNGENRTVLVAILSRMIITPVILLPIMALVMTKTTMRLFDDPVFVVANVLFISSPPALTLAQITQAASGDAFERLISKTIFWSYCIVTPITTMIYVFIGLELSRL